MSKRRRTLTPATALGGSLMLAALLGSCIVLGSSLGVGDVSLTQLLPGGAPLTEVERTILFEVRLPRVLLAALIGGALSVAGVVFQALLRNPLADPFVLGVSGGASIGGVVALLLGLGAAGSVFGGVRVPGLPILYVLGALVLIELGLRLVSSEMLYRILIRTAALATAAATVVRPEVGSWTVPACAFLGALGALFLIQWIATVDGRMTVYTILLTGAIFNAFSASLIYFIQSIASLQQLHEIVFYLMGRIPSPDYGMLTLLATVLLGTCLALFCLARDYNALSLGEEAAMQLGVDVERVKRLTFILGSLLTGVAVAVTGLIGFVGLVVPHILRLLLGPDHRLLLPAALFGGAAFLVLADLLSRLLMAPNELPVGVVTALIGGPFFLILLRRRSRDYGFR